MQHLHRHIGINGTKTKQMSLSREIMKTANTNNFDPFVLLKRGTGNGEGTRGKGKWIKGSLWLHVFCRIYCCKKMNNVNCRKRRKFRLFSLEGIYLKNNNNKTNKQTKQNKNKQTTTKKKKQKDKRKGTAWAPSVPHDFTLPLYTTKDDYEHGAKRLKFLNSFSNEQVLIFVKDSWNPVQYPPVNHRTKLKDSCVS